MSGKKGTNLGNNNAMKFKTPEERKALCSSYCDHVESGLSKESFPECDMQTFDKYVKEFPSDFDTNKIERAERIGRKHWEEMGHDMVLAGQGNATAWIFNMKNRFGWKDRHDFTSDDKPLASPIPYLPSKDNE